jgi:hypothetical protein
MGADVVTLPVALPDGWRESPAGGVWARGVPEGGFVLRVRRSDPAVYVATFGLRSPAESPVFCGLHSTLRGAVAAAERAFCRAYVGAVVG